MGIGQIVAFESNKKVSGLVQDLEVSLNKRGFIIHNKGHESMKDTYDEHNIEMPENFDLQILQLCKPDKSSKMLLGDIERIALMPKFINVFTKDGKTQIRMLRYDSSEVAALMGDEQFGNGMEESFNGIIKIIEEAL